VGREGSGPGGLRALALNLALLAGTVLVVLGLLEVLARLSRVGSQAKDTRAHYLEYDPLLGWRKKPDALVTFREPEYAVDVRTNSLGLRDPDRGYPDPEVFTVLALGDSFVEGYTVPLGATVTQVLETGLRGSGCPAEVINGGTSAYSTDQEYLFYTSEGIKYAPRVVVLFFYYNDIVYNALQSEAGTPKPILVLRDGELKVHRFPVERPKALRGEASLSPEPEGRVRSAALEWVRDRLWYGAPRTYDLLGRLGLWNPRRHAGAPLELRVYDRTPNERVEAGWEATGIILSHLAHETEARGARLLVAYVPSRMEVDEAAWRLSVQTYPLSGPGWDRELVLERLSALAKAAGIPLLDLTPALQRAGAAYFPRDGHWNALGHRTAAEAVRGFLREHGWLAGCTG
jgi:lysophospholipase L1-like esterase